MNLTDEQVKEHNNLVKDVRTKAILNTDINSYREAKKRRMESITLQSLTNDVNTIKNEFEEIKTLLKQIVKN